MEQSVSGQADLPAGLVTQALLGRPPCRAAGGRACAACGCRCRSPAPATPPAAARGQRRRILRGQQELFRLCSWAAESHAARVAGAVQAMQPGRRVQPWPAPQLGKPYCVWGERFLPAKMSMIR